MDTESQLIDGVIHLCADQEIMWSSAHFPSPGPSLHPTCFIFGRLICGPHKQMVQQVPSEIPLRTLSDGCPFLKVNPERLCRRIKDPWMLESIELPLKCPWESKETDTLVALVKEVGYMGWAAVKEELEKRGIMRTPEQCQYHWREVFQTELKQVPLMRTLENRSLGERWRKRDDSITAEFEALLCDEEEAPFSDLGDGLIMWAPLLACYLSPKQSLQCPPASLLPEIIQEDFLIGLSSFFRTPLIDRSGVLNQDWSCVGVFGRPDFFPCRKRLQPKPKGTCCEFYVS